jgi:hypothetical protein
MPEVQVLKIISLPMRLTQHDHRLFHKLWRLLLLPRYRVQYLRRRPIMHLVGHQQTLHAAHLLFRQYLHQLETFKWTTMMRTMIRIGTLALLQQQRLQLLDLCRRRRKVSFLRRIAHRHPCPHQSLLSHNTKHLRRGTRRRMMICTLRRRLGSLTIDFHLHHLRPRHINMRLRFRHSNTHHLPHLPHLKNERRHLLRHKNVRLLQCHLPNHNLGCL